MKKFLAFALLTIIWVAAFACHLSYYIGTPPVVTFAAFGKQIVFKAPHPIDSLEIILAKQWRPTVATMNHILILCCIYGVILIGVWMLASYIPRLFANRRSNLYGTARWATKKDLVKNGLIGRSGCVLAQTNDAVYVQKEKKVKGADGESRIESSYIMKKPGEIISHKQTQHVLVVGSTRSGKGINNVIPTCFSWSDSLVVMDPKGEAWEITAPFRAQFSNTVKFQPENPKESVHINPLLAIRRGAQTIPDIQNLAYTLIPEDSGTSDKFWSDEGRKLFTCVTGYVIYCRPPEEKTLGSVYGIFSNDSSVKANKEKSAIKQYLQNYADDIDRFITQNEITDPTTLRKYENYQDLPEPERKKIEKERLRFVLPDDRKSLETIKGDLLYFASCEDKQLSSVVSTMLSKLIVIADPLVQEVTSRSDFTYEDFLDHENPLSVYLVASLSSLARLSPLFKIIYEQTITVLTKELKKHKHKLLLVFDEFRQMGKMEIVEKALSLSAGYGVICMIIIQSYAQLEMLYHQKAALTDNFAYQVILRTTDDSTSQSIEKQLGQSTVKKSSVSYSGSSHQTINKGENVSFHETGRSLMTAQEVTAMPFEDVLILAAGMQPYKAKKIMWFLDDRFMGLKKKYTVLPKLEDNIVSREDKQGWFLLASDDIPEAKDYSREPSQNESTNTGSGDYKPSNAPVSAEERQSRDLFDAPRKPREHKTLESMFKQTADIVVENEYEDTQAKEYTLDIFSRPLGSGVNEVSDEFNKSNLNFYTLMGLSDIANELGFEIGGVAKESEEGAA